MKVWAGGQQHRSTTGDCLVISAVVLRWFSSWRVHRRLQGDRVQRTRRPLWEVVWEQPPDLKCDQCEKIKDMVEDFKRSRASFNIVSSRGSIGGRAVQIPESCTNCWTSWTTALIFSTTCWSTSIYSTTILSVSAWLLLFVVQWKKLCKYRRNSN